MRMVEDVLAECTGTGEMGLIVSELFRSIDRAIGGRSLGRWCRRAWVVAAILGAIAPVAGGRLAEGAWAAEPNPCGPAILERLDRHRLAAGETVETLASRYNLLPSTLLAFNPSLRGGQRPKPGTDILIPPINGIRVETQPGDTWQSIAQQYRVRADSLFTVNGCQPRPAASVFVPGVLWSPIDPGTVAPPSANDPDNNLARYPLSEPARTIADFGWQLSNGIEGGEATFNSHIILQGRPSAVVLAVGPGTVAFVGNNPSYPGQLVVINHQGGRQTRYANLGALSVQRGQRVNAGARLGTLPSQPANGRSSLWFEVRYNSSVGWIAQNPNPYLQRMQTRSTPAPAPAARSPQPAPRPPQRQRP